MDALCEVCAVRWGMDALCEVCAVRWGMDALCEVCAVRWGMDKQSSLQSSRGHLEILGYCAFCNIWPTGDSMPLASF